MIFSSNLLDNLQTKLSQPFNRTSKIDPAGTITITPRQIYIVPTRFGILFCFLLIGMLVGSNNYGINLGFMLTFLLAGIGLSAMIQTWRNLTGLEIIPGNVQSVFCGAPAIFPLNCHNHRPSERPGLHLSASEKASVFDLAGNNGAKIDCIVSTSKRGYLRPKRWTVFTYFPLGLFYAWAYIETEQNCLVYPNPIAEDLPLNQLFASNVISGYENDDNIDFHGHRKYQPGDNLKQLDWKALARGRGYLIKHFIKLDDEDVWLNWDDILGIDVEHKLSILCRAVLALSKANVTFGLSIPGTRLEPDTGAEHEKSCLSVLALFP